MKVAETRLIKTAKLIKDLSKDWTGTAKLYQLNPPLAEETWDDSEGQQFEYVVVSATVAMFSGPETYIFGCDDEGRNVNFSNLPGSFKGSLDHEAALQGAGYELIS